MSKVLDWFDERTGIRAAWRWAADEPIPGGARPRYVFGSVLMFLFMQQVVLGILLATYYSPSATDAWASVAYLNDRVTGGWFLRGLHHHGSSAMVVVLILHLIQVTLAGAYRKPRELNWFAGLAMAGLVFAFALTGYLLPWDQKGYWATQVATGIMGSVPGGEPLRVLLVGGHEYGNLTLTRFYALHVFVLPIGLAALLTIHLILFRRHGVTAPVSLSKAELERKTQPFYPYQLFYDIVAMAITGAILVGLTFYTHGSELFAPAQPASNFVARPEWYFLFLFELLKFFDGPLQIVATVILPGAATVFLLALPWIDRAGSRRVRERMPVLSGVAFLMAAVVALTAAAVVADTNNEKYQEGLVAARKQAEEARQWAQQGVVPHGGEAVFWNDPKYKAKMLFLEHCSTCHTVDYVGGEEAPELTGYSSRAWIAGLIRDSGTPQYFGNTKVDGMEKYEESDVSDEQLAELVEYVTSLMDPNIEHDAKLAARGQQLFAEELDCTECHELEAGKAGDAPNLHGHGTADWVARVIRDSSEPDLFGKDAEMPKLGEKLSEDEIALIAEFVASQRN